MREPKEDKESRVFASFNNLREETTLEKKERRIKSMNA